MQIFAGTQAFQHIYKQPGGGGRGGGEARKWKSLLVTLLFKLARMKASFRELQRDFMRQNEHLKGRWKWISIHIEVNYTGKNNPIITYKTVAQQKQDLEA